LTGLARGWVHSLYNRALRRLYIYVRPFFTINT